MWSVTKKKKKKYLKPMLSAGLSARLDILCNRATGSSFSVSCMYSCFYMFFYWVVSLSPYYFVNASLFLEIYSLPDPWVENISSSSGNSLTSIMVS